MVKMFTGWGAGRAPAVADCCVAITEIQNQKSKGF